METNWEELNSILEKLEVAILHHWMPEIAKWKGEIRKWLEKNLKEEKETLKKLFSVGMSGEDENESK